MSATPKIDSQPTHDQCLGEITFITKSLLWYVKVKVRQNGVKVKNPIPPTRRPMHRSTHHRCVGRHTTEIVISFSCILFWAVNVMDSFFCFFQINVKTVGLQNNSSVV